jgi:hypothetical protein
MSLLIQYFVFLYKCHREEKIEDNKRDNQKLSIDEDRQYNDQTKNDKQWSTKHYTENQLSSNTNPTNKPGWTHVLSYNSGSRRVKWHEHHVM